MPTYIEKDIHNTVINDIYVEHRKDIHHSVLCVLTDIQRQADRLYMCVQYFRERQTERKTQKGRQKERHRNTDKKKDTERQTERKTQKDRQRLSDNLNKDWRTVRRVTEKYEHAHAPACTLLST